MARSLLLVLALGVAAPLFGQYFDAVWDRKSESYTVVINVETNQTSTSELTLAGTVPSLVTEMIPLGNGFLCDPITNGHYTCRLGATKAYVQYQVAFFLTNPPGAPTTLYTATAQLTRDGVSGPLNTASLTAYGRIDLATTITGPATIVAGSTATYDMTVTNNGANTAVAPWHIFGDTLGTPSPGAVFTQFIADPGLCNLVSPASSFDCSVSDLAPGASRTLHLTVKAASNLAAPVKIGIGATASNSPSPEKELANNSASATSSVTYATDLAVAGSAPASASNGGDVPVSWTIANNGVSDASSVVFDTMLPANATLLSLQQTGFTCSTPGIGATGAIHCTMPSLGTAKQSTITVTMRPTAAGTMTNSATVSNARADTSSSNNSASVSTTISEATSAHADVSITATATAPRVRTNGDFGITLNVANAGPDTASSIVVTATLAAGFIATSVPSACSGTAIVTCSIPTLASGASTSFALQVRTASTAGSYTSTAAITTPNDTTAGNNSASVTTAVVPSLNLELQVSASPKFAFPGANVVWTFSPYVAVGSTTEAITLTDVVPNGMSVVKLPSNCSGTSTITCSVELGHSFDITLKLPATPGTYSNSATLTSIVDSDSSDNSASASVIARTTTDASITGHWTAGGSVPGGELTGFEIDLKNEGPAAIDPLIIAITFPDGSENMTDFSNCEQSGMTVTCNMGTFAAGTRFFNVGALVPLVPGIHTATARIVASGDLDPSNDSVSMPVTVTTPPATDLEVSSIAPFSVGVGEAFNITAIVTVKTGGRPHQVVLTDAIPAGTTLEKIYGPCEAHGTDVVCSFGSMVWAGSFLYDDRATLTLRAPLTPGSLTNRMSVTSFKDPNPANDSATQVVQVVAAPLPNVAATMNGGPISAMTADAFSFNAYFRNPGDSAVGNTETQIALPAGAVVRSVSPASACSISGTTINCHFTFAAHESVTVAVEATAPATAGSYTVTSRVLTPDGDPRDDQATETLNVAAHDYKTDVAAHITGPHNATRGDDVTSVINVTNNGGGDARNLTLRVLIPEGLGFRSLEMVGTPLTCQTPAVGSSGEIRCVAATYGQTQSSLTLVTRVASNAPSSVTTSVYISNEISDPTSTNDSDELQLAISAAPVTAPDLTVSITPIADVMAGSAATLQTKVTNHGNAAAGAITVTYAVDHGVIAGTSGAQCVASGSTATCTIASLAAAASVPIGLVVNFPPNAGQTRLSMTATTSGDDDSTTATIVTSAPRRRPVR
jgi:uncharacterized repeat protein (TIGR01451 family)